MSFSPLIDQRPLIPQGSEDCAEACLGMVLGHLGHNVDMEAILAYHNGVTDISVLLEMCGHFGLTGCYEIGANQGFDNNDKLVITLIHDNAYANPDVTGPFEHFIVVYDQPGGNSVQAANPWGARDINYPDSEFNPAYMGGIVVPVSVNQVVSPPQSQGDDMALLFGDRQDGSPANGAEYLLSGGLCVHIVTPDDIQELIKAEQTPGYVAALTGGTAAAIVAASQKSTSPSPALTGSLNVAGTLQVTE